MSTADAARLLARYGLDAVLTDADDPELWAAALAAHWPPPEDPELNVAGLSFGIWGSFDKVWRFARVGPKGLRAVPVEWPPAPPEDPWAAPKLPPRYPFLDLQVERPSAGEDRAVVEAGRTFGPLAGRGEARVWRRVTGGSRTWEESEEVVSVWRS